MYFRKQKDCITCMFSEGGMCKDHRMEKDIEKCKKTLKKKDYYKELYKQSQVQQAAQPQVQQAAQPQVQQAAQPQVQPQSKICVDCVIDRPLYHYNKHKSTADGHVSVCKSCMSKRRAEKSTKNTTSVIIKNK